MNKYIKQYNWITFNNFVDIFESSLDDFIEKESFIETINIHDIKIYEYPWNYFMLELSNKEKFGKLIDIYIWNYKEDWKYCKLELYWNQYPRLLSFWENNWTYYILTEATKKLTEITDSKKWIYKWVVIDPILYLNS